jgi:hypothetical protein
MVDLGVFWRAHSPVLLDIGPVLHPDDAVAGKMDALINRWARRDFLDVDAILASGRYTQEQLMSNAAEHNPGFSPAMFAQAGPRLGSGRAADHPHLGAERVRERHDERQFGPRLAGCEQPRHAGGVAVHPLGQLGNWTITAVSAGSESARAIRPANWCSATSPGSTISRRPPPATLGSRLSAQREAVHAAARG